MQYDDYSLPSEQVIKALSREYASRPRLKPAKVCKLSILEQRSKVVQLYECVVKQKECLRQFKQANPKINIAVDTDAHLQILSDMAGCDELCAKRVARGSGFKNSRSCFFNYLKTQCEILQLLTLLLFLKNVSLNKIGLQKVLEEQLKLFEIVVNS